jgi:predicted small lipoprotein YifL
MTKRFVLCALALAACATLAACGKTGDLERPAPVFGGKDKSDQARKTADAAAKAQSDAAARRNEQNNTVFDPASGPPTQAPYAPHIPGVSDPFGHAPPTAGQNQNNAPDQ